MKSEKMLLIFLSVLAIKDALLGSFLLFNLDWLLNIAGMSYSEDVKITASFFGVCVLIVSTLCIVAILWVAGKRAHDIFLSKFIGWWMVIAAVIVFFKIGKPAWSAIDFITGILILIPAYMYEKQRSVTVATT